MQVSHWFFFFGEQKRAYEFRSGRVGSEKCIKDRHQSFAKCRGGLLWHSEMIQVIKIPPPLKGPKPEISVGLFYCFEFSISRKCLGFFYFRTKFGILTWVLLVNLSNILTWFLLVNLTKNAQNFPALRAESVGVLLLKGGGYSQYPGSSFGRGILGLVVCVALVQN